MSIAKMKKGGKNPIGINERIIWLDFVIFDVILIVRRYGLTINYKYVGVSKRGSKVWPECVRDMRYMPVPHCPVFNTKEINYI